MKGRVFSVVADTGFDWATLWAGIGGALIAAALAVWGYFWQQGLSRRERRADIYGEAIRAVEDYLEAPYRILRKDGSSQVRQSVTQHISDVKSRISYYTALLELHCPQRVAAAYVDFVRTAQAEAGVQMTAAWKSPPITDDSQVPLGMSLGRDSCDLARKVAIDAMAEDLRSWGLARGA